MQLHSLSIDGLHGTLNLHLHFFEELNLLVGINGSGKTSALNVIEWLLKPNCPKLASSRYSRLSLEFSKAGKRYQISAEKTDTEVVVSLETDGEQFEPISVRLHPMGEHDEEIYERLGPEEHEQKTWEFLRSLEKPTVVSLERTITAEVEDVVYRDRPMTLSRRRQAQRASPLEHVQELFARKYATYRRAASGNDGELKSQIILTALHSPDLDEPLLPELKIPAESTEELEEKVVRYLSASIKVEDVEAQVRRFFSYFRDLSAEVSQTEHGSGKVLNLIQSRLRASISCTRIQ